MAAVSKHTEYTGSAELGEKVDGDTWLTPRWILDQLGFFDLDPCAAAQNPTWVCQLYFISETDGLNQKWRGRVFMNPPFSNTAKWLVAHSKHANGISLVPATVEAEVWRAVVWKRAKAILFLHGRTRFCNPDGSSTTGRPLRSVCLIAWTPYDAAILERCSLAGVFIREWKQDPGSLKTETPEPDQSTRDAIAKCVSEQAASIPLLQTEGGKLWAEDWVKEEVILRLESGAEVYAFDALPPAQAGEPGS